MVDRHRPWSHSSGGPCHCKARASVTWLLAACFAATHLSLTCVSNRVDLTPVRVWPLCLLITSSMRSTSYVYTHFHVHISLIVYSVLLMRPCESLFCQRNF